MLYQPTRRKSFKHGRGKTGDNGYISWVGMRARCYNPNDPDYSRYGGRGIIVCDRWMDENEGYLNFIKDLGDRPSKSHSVDRINCNGNYCPENCKWATAEEQSNNRGEYNHYLEHNNQRLTIGQWARLLSIPAGTIRARLRYNWSIEDALGTPISRSYIGRKSNHNSLNSNNYALPMPL